MNLATSLAFNENVALGTIFSGASPDCPSYIEVEINGFESLTLKYTKNSCHGKIFKASPTTIESVHPLMIISDTLWIFRENHLKTKEGQDHWNQNSTMALLHLATVCFTMLAYYIIIRTGFFVCFFFVWMLEHDITSIHT